MHVISQEALRDFAKQHADADAPLKAWFKVIKAGRFGNCVELKRTFGSMDFVPTGGREFYVFNVGGNKYRLIAAIHFNVQKLFIRYVLTHAEYDKGDWRK